MASNEIIYTQKTIDKRNVIKERIGDLKQYKNVTTSDVLGKIADGHYYEEIPSVETIQGYNAPSKTALPVEYLIMLHELYNVSYNYLFGVQKPMYDEADLKAMLSDEAYEKIVEISQDSFSNEILNTIIETYIPKLVDKIKATVVMKAISDALSDSENSLERDLFDNSLETDLHLYLRQMVNDILDDDTITLDHTVVRETYKSILEGLKDRAEVFNETYETLKDAYIYEKKYDEVFDKIIMTKAVALKEKLYNK